MGRRDLIRILTLGAAAATTGACAPFAPAEQEAQERQDKPRYRVTENVEAFYRVNRY
jgi:hypothetical protein